MVGQQDRLRGLQVRLAGHDGARMSRGLAGQCADKVQRARGHPPERVAQPHPEQRGHLVVSRAAGPQPTTQVGPDPVDQSPLQRGVHVLVGDQRSETPVGEVLGQAVQAGQQPVALIVGQQSGVEEDLRVGLGRGDVVRRQHPVEVGGSAQRGQCIGRAVGEPPAPQRSLVGAHVSSAARSRRAASLDDSPCT